MKPIISILIPCYKVERYIRQCLDSIFAINLPESEYEVLCFDDQSPDNTSHILHEYVQKHTNMRVVCSDANVGPGGGGVIVSSQSPKASTFGLWMEMI